MALTFFESKEVKIFPCYSRGSFNTTVSTQEEALVDVPVQTQTVVFDPEARLITETNFASIGGNFLGQHSYIVEVITEEGKKLTRVVINGYYFEIKGFAFREGQTLWIKLEPIVLASEIEGADSERITYSLASLDTNKCRINLDAMAVVTEDGIETTKYYCYAIGLAEAELDESTLYSLQQDGGTCYSLSYNNAYKTTVSDDNEQQVHLPNTILEVTSVKVSDLVYSDNKSLLDTISQYAENFESITEDKTGAIAVAIAAEAKARDDAIQDVNDKIGEVAKDSTVVAIISAVEANKADKADTLAGYGISDAYTKTEVNTAIDNAKKSLLGEDVSEAYNTLKEIQDILEGTDGETIDGLIEAVDANKNAIATLNGDASTEGSVDKKIATTIASYATKEALNVVKTTAEAAQTADQVSDAIDSKIAAKNLSQYAVAETVNAELAKKANTADVVANDTFEAFKTKNSQAINEARSGAVSDVEAKGYAVASDVANVIAGVTANAEANAEATASVARQLEEFESETNNTLTLINQKDTDQDSTLDGLAARIEAIYKAGVGEGDATGMLVNEVARAQAAEEALSKSITDELNNLDIKLYGDTPPPEARESLLSLVTRINELEEKASAKLDQSEFDNFAANLSKNNDFITNVASKLNDKVYAVAFDANGGSGYMSPKVIVGTIYSLPENDFTPPCHSKFKGWSTDCTGTTVIGEASIELTGNTTFFAIWEVDSERVSHHEAQAPTCTEVGWDAYVTCSSCDYTTYVEQAALGHSYGDWSVDTEPTESEEGKLCRTCSNNSEHKESQILPILSPDSDDYDYNEDTSEYTYTKDGQSFVFDAESSGDDDKTNEPTIDPVEPLPETPEISEPTGQESTQ